MSFQLPVFTPPDFTRPPLSQAPSVHVEPSPQDGVAPKNFHATSNYPEYVHLGEGKWILAKESRMDCVLVLRGEDLEVVEARRLTQGDPVVLGRTEHGEEGIFVHDTGFEVPQTGSTDKFTFRHRGTRETPFSRCYDELYEVLRHDRDHGYIAWILGPAVAFDKDSRQAMQGLIEKGYCQALMAGNALATHDLEASLFHTGLGQNIYTQVLQPLGHYNHLDVLNDVRRFGSIASFLKSHKVKDGIIHACESCKIPYLLAGSIRDDGPLPEVLSDVYAAQDAMREYAKKATTVIALATQLHAIAFGNMTPGYHVMDNGTVRPVYYYIVDMSEFATDKLANRGSAQAEAILTNVQDFMINLWNNLR